MTRSVWPALAMLFGLLAAGAIGYIVGQGSQPPVALRPTPAVLTPAPVALTPAPPPIIAEPATPSPPSPQWRGLVVSAEHRCAPYDADDYRYPQSVEAQLVAQLGGVYGPYTGRWFASPSDTDIEHIVARSEAHDSGLCAADADTRRAFARDPLNLTLADPAVNRSQKRAHDAAEWLPELNQCWFADRVIQVRMTYGLTVDRAEADALDRVLAGCASTAMIVTDRPPTSPPAPTAPPPPAPAVTSAPVTAVPALPQATPATGDALDLYDDNGNGRITCAEARKHGIAPVHRGHPAYAYMRDGDSDGVVCE